MKAILAVLIEGFCFAGIIYFYIQQKKKAESGEDQLLMPLEERRAKEAEDELTKDIEFMEEMDAILDDED